MFVQSRLIQSVNTVHLYKINLQKTLCITILLIVQFTCDNWNVGDSNNSLHPRICGQLFKVQIKSLVNKKPNICKNNHTLVVMLQLVASFVWGCWNKPNPSPVTNNGQKAKKLTCSRELTEKSCVEVSQQIHKVDRYIPPKTCERFARLNCSRD